MDGFLFYRLVDSYRTNYRPDHHGRRNKNVPVLGVFGINFGGWFTGKDDEAEIIDNNTEQRKSDSSFRNGSAKQGKFGRSFLNTMDTFENFKQSSRLAKATTSLQNDLSSTTVEASVEDGKVKVVYDCLQRPLSVTIDEQYFENADSSTDVANAVTRALRLAHSKSIERMDERMKNFYTNELNLPPPQ